MNDTQSLVEPFPNHRIWAERLQSAAAAPLQLCPDFPRIAARHEAWWNVERDGPPLLIAAVNRCPERPILRHLDLLVDPSAWLAARRMLLEQQAYSPDWFPWLRVDFGPVMLGGLLGAPVEFISDTTWTHACIPDDWSGQPDWTISTHNPWQRLLPELIEVLARDAQENYIFCTPSLGGSADVLMNMRGPEGLCLDLVDRPERIRTAVEAIYQAWRKSYDLIWTTAAQFPVGVINWVGMWSNQPYHVLECDFNYLIGPRDFQEFFLPDLVRQAKAAGRAIFHLDGPGAARHIDMLLEQEEIQAIQYVVGAGNQSRPWLPMLKKIQDRGRALQIACEGNEVLELAENLRPEGLAFLTSFQTTEEMQFVHHSLHKKR
jgi:hypothetical protein